MIPRFDPDRDKGDRLAGAMLPRVLRAPFKATSMADLVTLRPVLCARRRRYAKPIERETHLYLAAEVGARGQACRLDGAALLGRGRRRAKCPLRPAPGWKHDSAAAIEKCLARQPV